MASNKSRRDFNNERNGCHPMTATSTLIASSVIPPRDGSIRNSRIDLHDLPANLHRYRLGLGLYVVSVIMLFVGFSSAYIVRRAIPTYEVAWNAYSTAWETLKLPVPLLLVNTLLLIGASIAVDSARRSARDWAFGGNRKRSEPFLIILALLLNVGFVAGQGIAWHLLRSQGYFLISGARTAFFYVLTGTHGIHAILGIIALALIIFCQKSWTPARRFLAVDLTTWYTHAMTLLWIYLLCFLAFF